MSLKALTATKAPAFKTFRLFETTFYKPYVLPAELFLDSTCTPNVPSRTFRCPSNGPLVNSLHESVSSGETIWTGVNSRYNFY